MTADRRWRPLVAEKTGRAPTFEERWRAENPGARFDVEALAREAVLRLAATDLLPPALSSDDHGDSGDGGGDCQVTVNADSQQFGPPPGRRHRRPKENERPFRRPLDVWVERGGWPRGEDGASSLEVAFRNDREKRQIISRWQYELEQRGWTGLLRTKFGAGAGGEQRIWWWTTDGAAAAPPPQVSR